MTKIAKAEVFVLSPSFPTCWTLHMSNMRDTLKKSKKLAWNSEENLLNSSGLKEEIISNLRKNWELLELVILL